ncbi:MAG TPA: SRPBCC domain-containing protein [Pyrinomonadaceae bacterium]|nr:SRPBCC domain-containing protein [Pyrinomonadaceae bacterium]
MELKTKMHAEDGKSDLTITRDFDLPAELVFKAHVEPELFEQWMSHEYGKVKVVKFEPRKHGGWEFETSGPDGTVVFRANGTIHEFVPDKKITRTFEMDNSPFDVQLEFLQFEAVTNDTSRLTINSIYRSPELRDQMLKLPYAAGLSMAHDRLQDTVGKLR